MAGSKFAFLELKALDIFLSGVSFTPATTLYAALYTVAPTAAGGGTEVSGGAYTRVAITNNATSWPAASGSGPASKANGTVITFPTATAAWGTVIAFGLFDAASAGKAYYWGNLSTSRSVATGYTPSFAIGALTFTEV